jgi:glucose-6-phosphate isomerase
MISSLNLSGVQPYVSSEEIRRAIDANAGVLNRMLSGEAIGPADRGWFSPHRWQTDPLVDQIEALAEKIRAEAEVFVLVGIGGSNRGAQSVIESLGDGKVEILYAGDNVSSHALQKTLAQLGSRPVYVNVIAKDFNTLEPGIVFRVLRQHLESTLGEAARERIIVTGSQGDGQLHAFSQAYGCTYLPFPDDIGGRFSVISPVGLLPIAVAGVDIRPIIAGAAAAEQELKAWALETNPAVMYAAARNLLYEKGFLIENLVVMEPSLFYFARWWTQLYGETEGKNQRCIFPTASTYSEDLHAIGQYIQEGKRMVMETFLAARFPHPEQSIQPSAAADGFEYLDHKAYDDLNTAVYQAAVSAHAQDGVPCFQIEGGEVSPQLFGELFYFFMLSCCLSATLIGVNPFGQPGVEAYKRNMYRILEKPVKEPGL